MFDNIVTNFFPDTWAAFTSFEIFASKFKFSLIMEKIDYNILIIFLRILHLNFSYWATPIVSHILYRILKINAELPPVDFQSFPWEQKKEEKHFIFTQKVLGYTGEGEKIIIFFNACKNEKQTAYKHSKCRVYYN